jgi:hypothetical protein
MTLFSFRQTLFVFQDALSMEWDGGSSPFGAGDGAAAALGIDSLLGQRVSQVFNLPDARYCERLKAPRRFFDAVLWRKFNEVHADLWRYFEKTTERLIRERISADTADAEMVK